MRVSQKITVRLTPMLKNALEERCAQTGQLTSAVVREALEYALVPKIASGQNSEGEIPPGGGVAPDGYFPIGLAPFLVSAQQSGASVWTERRMQFCYVLALAEFARQISKNPLDEALFAELLRVGLEFKLLPGSDC